MNVQNWGNIVLLRLIKSSVDRGRSTFWGILATLVVDVSSGDEDTFSFLRLRRVVEGARLGDGQVERRFIAKRLKILKVELKRRRR